MPQSRKKDGMVELFLADRYISNVNIANDVVPHSRERNGAQTTRVQTLYGLINETKTGKTRTCREMNR